LSDKLTIMGTKELKKVVRRPRLSEEVCLALEGRIARGELKPGERLPAEKVLGEAFGVSRAVVREAVARLKADGRVETRQGAGAFVARVPKCLNFRFWQGDGPAPDELREIFELRAMIEKLDCRTGRAPSAAGGPRGDAALPAGDGRCAGQRQRRLRGR
jgi:GntR family transcriptional repressor for pyruvate dehydrogenase complex